MCVLLVREAVFLTGPPSSRDYLEKADGRMCGHRLAILSCKEKAVTDVFFQFFFLILA
jgi:hypothetical protein